MILLLDGLPLADQRRVFFSTLKIFSEDYLSRYGTCEPDEGKVAVAAVAGAIGSLIGVDGTRRDLAVEWLTSSSGAGLGEGVGIRRAVMALISQDRDRIVSVLEKSINQFGDQLYIKHSPMLQQEG